MDDPQPYLEPMPFRFGIRRMILVVTMLSLVFATWGYLRRQSDAQRRARRDAHIQRIEDVLAGKPGAYAGWYNSEEELRRELERLRAEKAADY